MAHNHSPQPFPRADAGAGSASTAGPQAVANLFYRSNGIFGAIILEMPLGHFALAKHNLSGAT